MTPRTHARPVASGLVRPLSVALLFAIAALPLAARAADEVIDGGATVTVPGTHASPWNVDGTLTIGDNGTGALIVTDGALASTGGLFMGRGVGGAGSLTVSDGATFSSAGTANIGSADSGSVLITGAGSAWTTQYLNFGADGSSLTIADGGVVTASFAPVGTAAHTVHVTDGGSILNAASLVALPGASFTIDNGAVANSQEVAVRSPDASISGEGSSLVASGNVIVGSAAAETGHLSLDEDAVVTVGGNLTLGFVASSTGQLTIAGGSSVTANGNLFIANHNSANATVVVTGAGSVLRRANDALTNFNVGTTSGGAGSATLTVADGGTVIAGNNGTARIVLRNETSTLNIGQGGAAGTVQAADVGVTNTRTPLVNFNHSGPTTFSPAIFGAGTRVTKTGSGTTTLTGASTYGGATAVNQGALIANNTLGATAITVAQSAVFGGSATHTGSLSLLGRIAPGAGVGTFTSNTATFGADAGYDWQISDAATTPGTGWDHVQLGGTLTFAATPADPFVVTLSSVGSLANFDTAQNQIFAIVTTTGGITGFSADAVSIDASALPEAGAGVWSLEQNGTSLDLVYTSASSPGDVSLAAASYEVIEHAGSLTVTVQRRYGSFGAASVNYAASDGSATAPADYTTTTGTLTWADGDNAPKTFAIPIVDDTDSEDSETFTITLSDAIGAALGTPSVATATIIHNDQPGTLALASAEYAILEGSGNFVVTVERSGGFDGPVSVDYGTTDGTATAPQDYASTTGTLQWADGDSEPKTFEVPIVDDEVLESGETFTITLANVTSAALGTPSSATVTISDVKYIDLAGAATGYLAVSNFKNSATQNGIEGRNDQGEPVPGHNGLPDYPNYQIPVGQTNAGVWTGIITAPQFAGADYSPLYAYNGVQPGDVTVNNLVVTEPDHANFSAGIIGFDHGLLNGEGTEVIPVEALVFDFDTYLWDGKTGGDHGGPTGQPWVVTNQPVHISPFSPIHTDYNDGSGAGNASLIYNISLANVTGSGLTFEDGQLVSMDIAADVNVLTRAGYFFVDPPTPTGSTTFTGSFTASGMNYAFDVDDTRNVALWTAIHMIFNRAGAATEVGDAAPAQPGTLALDSATYSVAEGDGSLVVTVNRSGGSDGAASVAYSTADGSAAAPDDYTATSGTLSWADGDGDAKTFEIPIVDDSAVEDDENFTITLGAATGASLGTPSEATVTITRDDVAQPGTLALSAATYAIAEDGGSLTVTVNRSGGSDGVASVDYATADASATAPDDYTAASGTLTWADGDGDAKTFQIPIVDDSTIEGEETFTVTLSNAAVAALGTPSEATVTITSDDVAQPGMLALSSATYAIAEDGGSLVVTVERSGGSDGAASVDYATVDDSATAPGDYIATSGTLTWLDGDATAKTFSIAIVDDSTHEDSESFTITLSNAVGAALGAPSQAVATIADDDALETTTLPMTLQPQANARFYEWFSDAFLELGQSFGGDPSLDGFFQISANEADGSYVEMGSGVDGFVVQTPCPGTGCSESNWVDLLAVTYAGSGDGTFPVTALAGEFNDVIPGSSLIVNAAYVTSYGTPTGTVTVNGGVITSLTVSVPVTFSVDGAAFGFATIPFEGTLTFAGLDFVLHVDDALEFDPKFGLPPYRLTWDVVGGVEGPSPQVFADGFED